MAHIHYFSRKGFLNEVKKSLEMGEDINSLNTRKFTSLMLATRARHTEIVLFLLEAGADPNLKGEHGRTALHFAARSGFSDIVTYLLEHNADPNITDNFGYTPIVESAMFSHKESVEILRTSGANTEVRSPEGLTVDEWISEGGVFKWAERNFPNDSVTASMD